MTEVVSKMTIDRRALVFGATAIYCGITFSPAKAAVELDLSKEEYGLPKLKGYLIDCTTSKGLKFPQHAADALANAKQAFAETQASSEADIIAWIVGTLASAGASPNDARSFAECVRSVAGIYGKIVEGFIRSTFGEAVIRTDDGREIKTFVAKNLLFRGNNAFKVEWDEGYRPVSTGVIVAVSEITTVPESLIIATCGIALFVFVGSPATVDGKTIVEQLFDACKEFF